MQSWCNAREGSSVFLFTPFPVSRARNTVRARDPVRITSFSSEPYDCFDRQKLSFQPRCGASKGQRRLCHLLLETLGNVKPLWIIDNARLRPLHSHEYSCEDASLVTFLSFPLRFFVILSVHLRDKRLRLRCECVSVFLPWSSFLNSGTLRLPVRYARSVRSCSVCRHYRATVVLVLPVVPVVLVALFRSGGESG